jgi:hypothetical protein
MDPLQHFDQAGLEAVINNLTGRLMRLEHPAAPAAGAPIPHISVKPKPPTTFDGVTNRDTDTWLYELEKYFAATGTVDPQRVVIVATFIKGPALQWWKKDEEHRAQHHLPPMVMWNDFRAAFLHRFQPVEASKTARAILQTIRQTRSVVDYCARFMKQMALINDMATADQIEYFTRGLQPAVQKEVVLKAPATLDDAMHLAARYDLLLASRVFRPAHPGYRSYNYQMPYQATNHRGTSSYVSGVSSGSAPMELGKMEGDDFEQPNSDDTSPSDGQVDTGAELFNVMQSNFGRPPNHNRVPNISKEEFTRCRRLGLCLRCKQPGHVARNCSYSADHARSSPSYPKAQAQRK